MKRIVWRCIGRQPTFRRLAACFEGSLYALDDTGRLLVNRNFGLDGSWQWQSDLPPDVSTFACAAGVKYYQTADRALYYLSAGSTAIRAGRPWAATEIAGTEDLTLDFSVLWALNDDKSLWRNATSGADTGWKKVGQAHDARKIAATQNTLFALNTNGSLWMNNSDGLDGAWELIGAAENAVEITAASDGQSGAIQLYALHDDFTIWQGVVISNCEISLATQNTYPVNNPHADWRSLADLSSCGVTTNVWTMGGHALHVNKGDSPEEFLNYSGSEIRRKLSNYLEKNPQLDPQTSDLVILDMEEPVPPSGFGRQENRDRLDAIVEAYRTRLRIAREKLPRAKLALYGVIVPEGQGRSGGQLFDERMRGYRRAAALDLFDEVDYLTPVLYTKWGPGDNCGAEYRLRYCSIAARTRMGITLTSGLVNKPLVPLLSLKVFNQGSQNKSEDLPIEVARSQLAFLQSRAEVARIVYWVPPRPDNPKNLYNSAREILSFFTLLKPCGH